MAQNIRRQGNRPLTSMETAFSAAFDTESGREAIRKDRVVRRAANRIKTKERRNDGWLEGVAGPFSLTYGYGNVFGADGESYFVHQSVIAQDLTRWGFRGILPGMAVFFKPTTDNEGRLQVAELEVRGMYDEDGAINRFTWLETADKRRHSDNRNYWLPDGDGVIHVDIDAKNGAIDESVLPFCYIESTDTAMWYTQKFVKNFYIKKPARSKTCAVILMDKKKLPVNGNNIPVGGLVLIAKKTKGGVRVVVRRLGKRHDSKVKAKGSPNEFKVDTNAIIIEQRLSVLLEGDITTESVKVAIERQCDDFLMSYHLEFVSHIMNAVHNLG